MRVRLTAVIALALFCSFAVAEDAIIVNSQEWQDAYLGGVLAGLRDEKAWYIYSANDIGFFTGQLTAQPAQKAVLFNKNSNPIPTLRSSVEALGTSVEEYKFNSHVDLSAYVIRLSNPQSVAIVRDDFAFDALSAKSMVGAMKTAVVFSNGLDSVDPKIINAMRETGVRKVYLIGRLKPSVEAQLGEFNVERINGRDERETNVIIQKMTLEKLAPLQGIVTTGSVIESTMMNNWNEPVFLVPELGTYYMVPIADILNERDLKYLLGIGQSVANPGYWLKERTGARIFVKLGSVTAENTDEQNIRKDINSVLTGYVLAAPVYVGNFSSFAHVGSTRFTVGSLQALADQKMHDPIEFSGQFYNDGTIEFPVRMLVTIRDANNNTVTAIESERMMAYPKQPIIMRAFWNDSVQGDYFVEASVFGEIEDGRVFQPIVQKLELSIFLIILPGLMMLLILVFLAANAYALRKENLEGKEAFAAQHAVAEELGKFKL